VRGDKISARQNKYKNSNTSPGTSTAVSISVKRGKAIAKVKRVKLLAD
jgi:hypothetical protein